MEFYTIWIDLSNLICSDNNKTFAKAQRDVKQTVLSLTEV